jgi:hypothetical protein
LWDELLDLLAPDALGWRLTVVPDVFSQQSVAK